METREFLIKEHSRAVYNARMIRRTKGIQPAWARRNAMWLNEAARIRRIIQRRYDLKDL